MKPLIEKLIAAYDATVSKFSWPQDVLLLLIRIAWGFAFFQAGWGKIGRLEDVGQFFAGLGIPAPEFNAALVASVETVGGLMLVLGLFSRLAAVPLAFNMVVAYLTAHTDELKNKMGTGEVVRVFDDVQGLPLSLLIEHQGLSCLKTPRLRSHWNAIIPCAQSSV